MNKFYIRYAPNSRILHIRIGRYHMLIIRNDNSFCDRWLWGVAVMDRTDIYMTVGCVSIPLAVAAYELGYPFTGTALCIISGACMLLAIRSWTSHDRDTEKWR